MEHICFIISQKRIQDTLLLWDLLWGASVVFLNSLVMQSLTLEEIIFLYMYFKLIFLLVDFLQLIFIQNLNCQ